ncbi:MAG: FISUMP domain-containing protein [Lentimicrobium sp.]|jgi:uncharacterized protein (TIGR02145 family)|nr:FISUMP domain-containing protein [Lentimicrobium sp.]
MKNIYVGLLIIMAGFNVFAQNATNVKFEFSGDQIVVYYDLPRSVIKSFWVDLFISTDNKATWIHLTKVTGDVGPSMKSGLKKKIIWDRFVEGIELRGKFDFLVFTEPDIFDGLDAGRFIDRRDGISYKWKRLGNQIWMIQNLNTGYGIEGSVQSMENNLIEKYCYNNDPGKCDVYGGLYQWDEATQYSTVKINQGICPKHWHIPDSLEWENLISFLGGPYYAYGNMKELGNNHWIQKTKGTTNLSRFTVLPGGLKDSDTADSFVGLNNQARFWTSTENDTASAKAVGLNNQLLQVYFFSGLKSDAYSVRCVRD